MWFKCCCNFIYHFCCCLMSEDDLFIIHYILLHKTIVLYHILNTINKKSLNICRLHADIIHYFFYDLYQCKSISAHFWHFQKSNHLHDISWTIFCRPSHTKYLSWESGLSKQSSFIICSSLVASSKIMFPKTTENYKPVECQGINCYWTSTADRT